MDIKIITAEPYMALEIAAVHIAAWQSAYKGIICDEYLSSLNADEWIKNYKFDNALGDESYFFSVNLEDNIIGLLYLCKYRDEDLIDSAEIGGIYLSPEYWQKGIGRIMMEFSLYFLKSKGYKDVYIWALEANTRAKQFYNKFGFFPDGRKKQIKFTDFHNVIRYSNKK